MKVTIRIQDVFGKTLEESNKELVVKKGRTIFIGALFFKKDSDDVLKKVHDEITIEGSTHDVILAAYYLLKKHDMLAKDDKTLKTMLHWQYINGFSDDLCGYNSDTDTEYLASLI